MATEAKIQRQAELSAQYSMFTEFAKWNLCAECNGPLVVRWTGEDYELSCGGNHDHTGTKSWRETPAQKKREAKQMAVDKGIALEPYTGRAELAQAEAMKLLKTLWPEAPATEVLKASLICWEYGLNPLMKHIYLVKYDRYENKQKVGEDWSIQIGIGATRMIARRSGAYSYEDNTPRLMTEAEQVAILGEVDAARYWAITRLRDQNGFAAQGYGNWPKDTRVKGDNKGNTPQNMAFIRSERAALDKLFPEKLPKGETMAAEYEDVPILSVVEKPKAIPPQAEAVIEAKATGPVLGQDGPQTLAAPPAKPAPATPAKPNGAGSKLTPPQSRTIEALALKLNYAYPQGLEAELAQHLGYPAKVADLTVAQAGKVIDWLNGKGIL